MIMGAKTPVYKIKVWKTKYADEKFSEFIRARDPICKRCDAAPSRDNSHYWKRGHSGTRFDPRNCVGLCRPCHDLWEHRKNDEYKDFMVSLLGPEEYDAVEKRARTFMNRTDAVLEWMRLAK